MAKISSQGGEFEVLEAFRVGRVEPCAREPVALSEEKEVLPDGELFVERELLGDVPDPGADFGLGVTHVHAEDFDFAR